MRVGVVEIMETGHITLAETLCRIFCCDPGNKVYLFIIEKHAENLGFLCTIYPNLDIVVKDPGTEICIFLNETGEYRLDRLYIVTLTKYYFRFSKLNLRTSLFLTIHNIDEWFGNSFIRSVNKFLYSISGTTSVNLWIYFFKVNFVFPHLKRAILRKVSQSDGRLVVLSGSLQKKLISLNITIPSEIVPFSIFDPSLITTDTPEDAPLRICVPGILSQYRRNYMDLLDLIEKKLDKYKSLFILDLLGGVHTDNQFDNPHLILKRIDLLKNKGFSIIDHRIQFIPPLEYNKELAKSDIILGNMNVVLNKYSVYGKTKETGIPFAMIRAARPGIVPDTYPVPEELSSSTLVYSSFENLGEILINLISNSLIVKDLKNKALENSKRFTPESIYYSICEKYIH